MGIEKLNRDQANYDALMQKVDAQKPCLDDDGFGEFRQKYGQYSHLNLEELYYRSNIDPDLQVAVDGYRAELEARAEGALRIYDDAIAEAERALADLKGIRDRARAEGADEEPEPGLLGQ